MYPSIGETWDYQSYGNVLYDNNFIYITMYTLYT